MDVNRDATVDEEGPAPTPTPPNDAPRLQRLVMVCSVAGVIALGGLALGATVVHERDTVAGREQQAADQAAAVVRERLVRSVSALQGVRGLAVDGTVTPAEFDAYAADALAAADFPWLARHVAVDGDRRAAWEAANGVEIVDRADGGDGPDGAAGGDGLVRAPERNRYAPVVAVSPAQAPGRAPRGLDLLGERSAVTAAEESAERDRPTVTDAMPLPDGGGPAFLVVEALTAPDPAREGGGQRVVGYVSGSLPVADLAAGAAAGLPDGTSVALLDGDRPLAGDGEGKRADVSAAGTSLVVAVDTPTSGNATLPLVVALVTVTAT
ncbi:MAG TPA: CHASE domain-containing protein, partial [Acidimicrobiales bacterium]